MRAIRSMLITIALSVALVSACGETPTPTGTQANTENTYREGDVAQKPVIPRDERAGASGVDNMTWQFGEGALTEAGVQRLRLMYASYGSEGLAINLQCDPGANNAYAILWRGQVQPSWQFTLQSGAARAELTGSGIGESEVTVTAPIALDAPVLRAFGETGELTLTEEGRTFEMNAINEAERRTIAQFFQTCA